MANVIGARIKALREERKLSQDDLARLFGFKDRQTVSAIETGERRVTAEELILAVEKLGVRNALVVEDSDVGVASATAAGLDVLRIHEPSEMPTRLRERLGLNGSTGSPGTV